MEEKLDKLIEIVGTVQIKMEVFQKSLDKFQETQNIFQESLDKFQETQDEFQESLDKFQETQDEFQESQDKMQTDITQLKFDVKTLKSDNIVLDTHILQIEKDLESLKNTVCLIEENHGRKLQALLDRDLDYIRKDTEYNCEFTKINKTLDMHDARIYNLEHLA